MLLKSTYEQRVHATMRDEAPRGSVAPICVRGDVPRVLGTLNVGLASSLAGPFEKSERESRCLPSFFRTAIGHLIWMALVFS